MVYRCQVAESGRVRAPPDLAENRAGNGANRAYQGREGVHRRTGMRILFCVPTYLYGRTLLKPRTVSRVEHKLLSRV